MLVRIHQVRYVQALADSSPCWQIRSAPDLLRPVCWLFALVILFLSRGLPPYPKFCLVHMHFGSSQDFFLAHPPHSSLLGEGFPLPFQASQDR